MDADGGGASQSTEPAAGTSAATDISLREHLEMMVAYERKLTDRENSLREKALAIKEEADKAALGLAREIQTYKDEKANELREQISSERGLYATKSDVAAAVEKVEATLKPLSEYVSASQGQSRGVGLSARAVAATIAAVVGGLAIIGFLAARISTPAPAVVPVPVTVTTTTQGVP